MVDAFASQTEDCDNFKVFVGQKASGQVELYANFNLPNLKIDSDALETGTNYVIRGRAHASQDIAAEEICLPPSEVEETDRIFEDYSIYTTNYKTVSELLPNYSQQELEDYLATVLFNYEVPAFFSSSAFLGAGLDNKPASIDNEFSDLSDLTPFAPSEIRDLDLNYIQ